MLRGSWLVSLAWWRRIHGGGGGKAVTVRSSLVRGRCIYAGLLGRSRIEQLKRIYRVDCYSATSKSAPTSNCQGQASRQTSVSVRLSPSVDQV